jgi:hypothetical protein
MCSSQVLSTHFGRQPLPGASYAPAALLAGVVEARIRGRAVEADRVPQVRALGL